MMTDNIHTIVKALGKKLIKI